MSSSVFSVVCVALLRVCCEKPKGELFTGCEALNLKLSVGGEVHPGAASFQVETLEHGLMQRNQDARWVQAAGPCAGKLLITAY